MTSFEVARVGFSLDEVGAWALLDRRNMNWPVVYVLDDGSPAQRTGKILSDVYVGESLNAAGRMRQHLATPEQQHLSTIRVIFD